MRARSTPARVLVAKPGLDGHDRGAKVVARALFEAGLEVIYSGLRQTPRQIVAVALQEDVDVIGLSILSGAHIDLTRQVLDELARVDARDIAVVVGGTVLERDIPRLKEMGVAEIFPVRTPLATLADRVSAIAAMKRT